jgi:hypothetical protein
MTTKQSLTVVDVKPDRHLPQRKPTRLTRRVSESEWRQLPAARLAYEDIRGLVAMWTTTGRDARLLYIARGDSRIAIWLWPKRLREHWVRFVKNVGNPELATHRVQDGVNYTIYCMSN